MTQHCPLCGRPVNAVYAADPDSLAGRYYFCRGSPGSCRATFMIDPDVKSPADAGAASDHEVGGVTDVDELCYIGEMPSWKETQEELTFVRETDVIHLLAGERVNTIPGRVKEG